MVATGSTEYFRHQFGRMLKTAELELDDPGRASTAQDSEWLKILYQTHRNHIQGDLDRGWKVLQLFVPLSLAPFAGIVLLGEVRVAHILILAAASTTLLLTANMFVDRITLHESLTWELVHAIEQEVGLQDMWPFDITHPRVGGFRLRHIRWTLVVVVAVLWALLALAVAAGLLDSVPGP